MIFLSWTLYSTECSSFLFSFDPKGLAKYADGVLNPLSAVDKEKAERIFIQLIRSGEGTEDTKRKATRGGSVTTV